MAKRVAPSKTGSVSPAPPAKAPLGKAPIRGKSFSDLVAGHEPVIAATAKRLRELVTRLEPEAVENIYGGAKIGIALYSIGAGNKVLCGIQPARGQCLFYIHHVTETDAPELLLQGTGKNNRHLKFKAPPEIDAKAIGALLKLARTRIV
jgi:hypothetical protein